MTQEELTLLNIGDNLDNLMNLDPRGYGVCRILYDASRKYTGKPLCLNAAEKLLNTVKDGDLVYILSGFVLLDHGSAETDGIVSSVLLCRSLVLAMNAKPVIICQQDNVQAVKAMARVVGLHIYDNIDDVLSHPVSMGVIPFTTDKDKAEAQADEILSHGKPSAVIANEFPGENRMGEFHNAVGKNTTHLEAKADILFDKIKEMGILNIAIGDLGNEMGMATILPQLDEYIPYAAKGRCNCGCGGGIAVRNAADNIITATVSDWGCYAMIAMMAYLKGDLDIMHDSTLEKEVLDTAVRNGMVDMYGWHIPAIDGFSDKFNMLLVDLMRECISYPLKLKTTCKTWFDKTIELGFYEGKI